MSINLSVSTTMPFWEIQTPTEITEHIIGGWDALKYKPELQCQSALDAIARYKDCVIACHEITDPSFCYSDIVHKCNWILFMKPKCLSVSYL